MFKMIITLLLIVSVSNADLELENNRYVFMTADSQIVAKMTQDDKRVYPFKSTMEPLLGYVSESNQGKYALEEAVGKATFSAPDIQQVQLTIDLSLQAQVEQILDTYKEKLQAEDILTAVMESNTGRILAMASSNRYDPNHIKKEDVYSIIQKFSAWPHEPGYVMAPLSLAIALDKGLVEPKTVFNLYGGRMQLDDHYIIKDSEKFDTLDVTDIILHSSNIGVLQVSQLLSGYELREGLKKFGFADHSYIEFLHDYKGFLKPVETLEILIHRASTSYGYGMMATFTQLLKAYNAFNNDGMTVTPYLINALQDSRGDSFEISHQNGIQAIGAKTAQVMHGILLENVKGGTGMNTQYDGLEIGGKTGTAYIAKNGRYVREFHSSFYGFANDGKGNKYTIGVLVVRAKAPNAYVSSRSAVPIFRKTIESLVQTEYLQPYIPKEGNINDK